ncbi:hypothetical protein BC831DRAFT_497478 [Entophlyctis helioformis]|nr:hypothetical protein BC831DRAFT_497478 [Entophlyctis helioformis]
MESESAAFVACLRDIHGKTTEIRARTSSVLSRVTKDELPTAQGVSLLEVRIHSLLSYITNLGFLSLLKLHGESIQNHKVVDHLVELRAVLERTKPLEQKLKYQIDKLVKAAVMQDDADRMARDHGDQVPDDADASLRNPLQFKPNPMALMGNDSKDGGEQDGNDDDGGVYRPPRVAPVHYDESSMAKKGRLSQQLKERASKSRLLRDIRAQYDDRPEELDAEGTGYGRRELGTTSKAEEAFKEREEFEEANFMRLAMSKKDKQNERMLGSGRVHLARFQNEFSDLNSDFRELSGVHHAVEEEDRARYGEGVEGKRKKRAERFTEAAASKRARYADAEDMISTVSRARKSDMGPDAFNVQKRTIKKFGAEGGSKKKRSALRAAERKQARQE